MGQSVIGAQMYTVYEHCKTPLDIAKSCRRIRQMGYEAVQASGIGPIEAGELAKILDGEGLTCAATHKSMDDLKNTNAVLDYHAALKCSYTAIGGFGWGGCTLAQWQAFAAEYSTLAKTLAAKGLHIGYHNHDHELARIADAPTVAPLDLLVKSTDPAVWFEIDTYWIAFAGGDPTAWIKRVAGRIPCLHLKDMLATNDRKPKMCEIGAGNLNWAAIFQAAQAAGVRWYLVERDSGDLDPFESLKISLENLHALGLT